MRNRIIVIFLNLLCCIGMSNAQLDTSFAYKGICTVEFNDQEFKSPTLFYRDSHGRFYSRALLKPIGSTNYQAFIRYQENGTIDSSFNLCGKLYGLSSDLTNSTQIMSMLEYNDKLYILYKSLDDFSVRRYLYSGEVDTSFGNFGEIDYTIAGNNYSPEQLMYHNSNLYVFGTTVSPIRIFAYKIDLHGATVTSFGTGGCYTHPSDSYFDKAIFSNDSIVMGGSLKNGVNYYPGFIKSDLNGILSPSFGLAGVYISPSTAFPINFAVDFYMDPNDEIYYIPINTADGVKQVRKLLSNGSPDNSFFVNGTYTYTDPNYLLSSTGRMLFKNDTTFLLFYTKYTGPIYRTYGMEFYRNAGMNLTYGSGGYNEVLVTNSFRYKQFINDNPSQKIYFSGDLDTANSSRFGFFATDYDCNVDLVNIPTGYATFDVGNYDNIIYDIEHTSDGDVLVASFKGTTIELLKYNSDGTRDAIWEANGPHSWPLNFGNYFNFLDETPNGKILFAKQDSTFRLNLDGTLDLSFGTGGFKTYLKLIEHRTVIKGDSIYTITGANNIRVLDLDCNVIASFNASISDLTYGANTGQQHVTGIAVDNARNIYVLYGIIQNVALHSYSGVFKFGSNFLPDYSFNVTHAVQVVDPFPTFDSYPEKLMITKDDKLIVAGYTENSKIFLSCLNTDGTLVTSYGFSGTTSVQVNNVTSPHNFVMLSDNDVYFLYYGPNIADNTNQVFQMRIGSNGALDVPFTSMTPHPIRVLHQWLDIYYQNYTLTDYNHDIKSVRFAYDELGTVYFAGRLNYNSDEYFKRSVFSKLELNVVPFSTAAIESINNINQVMAYPNPFTDCINLTNVDDACEGILYSIGGQILWKGIISGGKFCPEIPNGSYILELKDKSGKITKKLIKL